MNILDLVKNKYFWIGLLALILIFILWKNSARIKSYFSRLIGKSEGDYQPYGITEQRKLELQALAQKVYEGVNTYSVTTRAEFYDTLDAVNAINDNELEYLAKYYEKNVSESSLYADIDDEWMPGGDIDEKILTRLKVLNLQ